MAQNSEWTNKGLVALGLLVVSVIVLQWIATQLNISEDMLSPTNMLSYVLIALVVFSLAFVAKSLMNKQVVGWKVFKAELGVIMLAFVGLALIQSGVLADVGYASIWGV